MGSPIDHSIQYGCGMAKVSCMNDLYLNNKQSGKIEYSPDNRRVNEPEPR